MNVREPPPKHMLRWIAWAIWAWGGVLALGSYLMFEVDGVRTYDVRRPLVVMVCVGIFQLFWTLASSERKRRSAERDDNVNE